VYLAQDGRLAVHGVGRASQYFFGKDVRELDVHEAALLAGMIRGPSLYNPRRNPERARERRDLVLRMMRDAGVLDEDAFAHAVDRPLRLSDPTTRTPIGR
jgi:penicillin-binding protein 1B